MTSVFCTSTRTPAGLDAGERLDGQDRVEERAAAAAVLLGNLDAHQAELEKIRFQVFVEDGLLVHLLH